MDPPGSVPPGAGGEPPPRTRSPLRLALAVAMVLAGTVWVGQGLGILTAGRSFMIGDPTWALIGAGFAVTGVILGAREVRRR